MNNLLSLVLPCDAVRDVKWKSTNSIGNIILQTCGKTAQQTFRCIIYVVLAAGSRFIQEGGVLWGIWTFCRSRLSWSSWNFVLHACPMNIPLYTYLHAAPFKCRLNYYDRFTICTNYRIEVCYISELCLQFGSHCAACTNSDMYQINNYLVYDQTPPGVNNTEL